MISERIILWTTKHGDPTQAETQEPGPAKKNGVYTKPWAAGTYVFVRATTLLHNYTLTRSDLPIVV